MAAVFTKNETNIRIQTLIIHSKVTPISRLHTFFK